MSIKLLCVLLLACWAFLGAQVWAALPSNEQWRLALLDERVGYGENADGGADGTMCYVTTLNNTGAGSLRACAESTNTYWIAFSVSGTITLESALYVRSNKTIDGRGADITLTAGSTFPPVSDCGEPKPDSVLLLMGSYCSSALGTITNVIITHLKISNAMVNIMLGIMEQASDIWINHITFQNSGDEQLFVGCGNIFGNCGENLSLGNLAPRNITLSWLHGKQRTGTPPSATDCGASVWCSKTLLVGSYSPEESLITITAHHNWYQTDARHPAMNDATFHAFNNLYDGTAVGSNAVNTNLCQESQFRSDNDILDLGTSPGYSVNPIIAGNDTVCSGLGPNSGRIACAGAMLVNGATCQSLDAANIFTPPYSYSPATANSTLRTAIEAGAGWQAVSAPSDTVSTLIRVIQ
jgi:pectate lyase